MKKNVRLFTMRVSDQWIALVKARCRRKARTVTGQIERAIELAAILDEYCDGNDDPEFVRKKLGMRKSSSGKGITRL